MRHKSDSGYHTTFERVVRMAAQTPSDLEPVACDCGAEMELAQSGTAKSMPLVGDEVTYRLYSCPDCGAGKRYERGDDGWTRAVE